MAPSTQLLHPAEARILICDELAAAAIEDFRKRGFEPEIALGLSEDELVEKIIGFHAAIVRSATKITKRVLEAADELRVVGRAGVGVDNVDCETATKLGIVVMNTPTGNTTTTGELAVALICSLARHVATGNRRVRAGTWSKKGLLGTELTGKRIGVVGLGRIGRVVADRCLGLHMEVVAHDPYLQGLGKKSPIDGVELIDLDELIQSSDFITLHVPLLDSTRNLLSRERLESTRPGVRIINAARGGLIDEEALADLLDSGHIAGAALDVLAQEPPAADHPLVNRENVLITPHLGASSHEAQFNVAVDIARQIGDFLAEGVAHNAVNAPAVSATTLKQIAPYVLLAEKIGSFLAQSMDEPIRKLEVTLSGQAVGEGKGYLPLSILVGSLRRTVAGVNYVNAPLIAKDNGIRLLEGSDEESYAFQDLIKVRASSRGGEMSHVVCGTVFGSNPRLVRVDDLHLDLDPTGCILITTHNDQPGVIGDVGTILGEAGVNIRRMELGSGEQRNQDRAMGFLSLDCVPDSGTMTTINDLKAIEHTRLIEL
ncbi:MAG: D-3-phosphoglycerate dehydrogenase [Planctomycetota bacterium]|jgi:D-3-phosphoglycerate dehydrogenase